MFIAGLTACVVHGRRSSPRDMEVFELPGPVTFVLTDTSLPFVHNKVRKARYRFGMIEAVWMLSGSNLLEPLRVAPKMAEFSDDGKTLWGAYGPRLISQLNHVLDTLKRDSDSRQAVITTWRPMVRPSSRVQDGLTEVMHPAVESAQWDGSSYRSKDVPCTVAWMFSIRDDRLDLTVTMRSHDAWLGMPYDVFSFTTVQRVVASCLGVEPGKYTLVCNNLHLYARDMANAVDALNADTPVNWPLAAPEWGETFAGYKASGVAAVFKEVLVRPEIADELRPGPFDVWHAACHNRKDSLTFQAMRRPWARS